MQRESKEMSTIENISLRQQVRESVTTNSIVYVDAVGCQIVDIMTQLSWMEGIEDADYNRENDGTWDVYGTTEFGDEFRLRVKCND